MKYRWSGAVAYDAEQAAQRLEEYFRAIGYRAAAGTLRWVRGSLWRSLTTLSPRELPMSVEAKLQPWGAHTLVDLTYDLPRPIRSLSALDADLLVAELRELTRYLQHGAADFEQMAQLERAATRRARHALLGTLFAVILLLVPVAWLFYQLNLPSTLAALLGGALGGILTSYLFWRLLRR
ncbi:MAG: hypothetical protein RMK45_07045 [Armatimonadota bacterium]|nr:hypothetical protein [Armatimonadota bacterium]